MRSSVPEILLEVLEVPISLSFLHELTLSPASLTSSVFSHPLSGIPNEASRKEKKEGVNLWGKRKIPEFRTSLILLIVTKMIDCSGSAARIIFTKGKGKDNRGRDAEHSKRFNYSSLR